MGNARAAIALAVALTLGFVVTAACGGPYTGKPDRLRKPDVRDGDDDDDDDKPPPKEEIAWDEKCRTNFFDTPTKRRNGKEGKRLAVEATSDLDRSDTLDGAERVEVIKDGISTLRRSLKKDPYGPEATYKMAVAYTLLLKKKCAIRLLERLAELEQHPKVGDDADRVIERALRDATFDDFRKEADRAMGR